MPNLPLIGKYIAITRPSEQAKKLSGLIEVAGGTPILFPLIDITPLEDYALFDEAISQVVNYDWAIFISSNAVQNGMPHLFKKGIPPNLRFAAIGPVTANELVNFGAKNVLIPKDRFDSEALLEMPEMQNVSGIKFMIFRGIGGREILAETLQKRGAEVTFAECYRRTNPQTNCNVLKNLWIDNKLHAIVVTSSEAMRFLLNLAENERWLKNTPIFVNHDRVAVMPLSLGLKLNIAETGGDEAMFELLRTTLSQSDLHK
jgi:uroporphyrinogen-III synthase